VVLHGCETWSLILREELRLRAFENRVLRIFGQKRDEVTRSWRTLRNEGRACSKNGEKRNAYMILVGKPEGKRILRRPRRRWVDNIKMDLREID
jgi:hypothetical protein